MISKILAAVDGSEGSDRALDTAIEMSRKLEVPLVIVNVMEDYGDATKIWKQHDSVVKEIEHSHEELLIKYQKLAEKALHTTVKTVRAEGYAAEQILKCAEKEYASIIVIGSRGFNGAKEFLMGSVSHKVVLHSKRPVLVVK